MKRYNFVLSERHNRLLELAAEQENISKSEYLRRLISITLTPKFSQDYHTHLKKHQLHTHENKSSSVSLPFSFGKASLCENPDRGHKKGAKT